MFVDFDKIFHKSPIIIPKDCPCRKCNEPKYAIDNSYYHSEKCERCNEYKEWRNSNEQ